LSLEVARYFLKVWLSNTFACRSTPKLLMGLRPGAVIQRHLPILPNVHCYSRYTLLILPYNISVRLLYMSLKDLLTYLFTNF